MSTLPDTVAAQDAIARGARGVLAIAILNTIAVTILFGSEAAFMAISLDWSLAGLLHLGPTLLVPVVVLTVALAAWATFLLARRAWRFESTATG